MPMLAKRPEQFLLPSVTETQEALHTSPMPVVNSNRNSIYAGHNPRMAIVQPRVLQNPYTSDHPQGMHAIKNMNTPINANQEVKDVILSRLRHQMEQKEEFLNRPNRPLVLEPSHQQLSLEQKQAIKGFSANHLKPDWPELKSDYAKSLDSMRQQQSVSQELSEIQNSRLAIREQFFKDQNTIQSYSPNNAYFSLPTSPYYVQDQQQPHSSMFLGTSSSSVAEGSSSKSEQSRLEDRNLRVMGGASPIPSQGLRIVSERTKQFESGRPLSPDGVNADRTSLYKSELSR